MGFFPSGPNGPLAWVASGSEDAGMRGGRHYAEVTVVEPLGDLGVQVLLVNSRLSNYPSIFCLSGVLTIQMNDRWA